MIRFGGAFADATVAARLLPNSGGDAALALVRSVRAWADGLTEAADAMDEERRNALASEAVAKARLALGKARAALSEVP